MAGWSQERSACYPEGGSTVVCAVSAASDGKFRCLTGSVVEKVVRGGVLILGIISVTHKQDFAVRLKWARNHLHRRLASFVAATATPEQAPTREL